MSLFVWRKLSICTHTVYNQIHWRINLYICWIDMPLLFRNAHRIQLCTSIISFSRSRITHSITRTTILFCRHYFAFVGASSPHSFSLCSVCNDDFNTIESKPISDDYDDYTKATTDRNEHTQREHMNARWQKKTPNMLTNTSGWDVEIHETLRWRRINKR